MIDYKQIKLARDKAIENSDRQLSEEVKYLIDKGNRGKLKSEPFGSSYFLYQPLIWLIAIVLILTIIISSFALFIAINKTKGTTTYQNSTQQITNYVLPRNYENCIKIEESGSNQTIYRCEVAK